MANAKKSYQVLQIELNDILDWFTQTTDISIDEALLKYKKGNQIISELRKQLKDAENKIKEIRV